MNGDAALGRVDIEIRLCEARGSAQEQGIGKGGSAHGPVVQC